MRARPARTSLVVTLLLLGVFAPRVRASDPAGETGALLGEHAVEVAGLQAAVTQIFGSLPAVASTPFLGLAGLTAAALIADTEAARTSDNPWVRRLRENALVREARRYASLKLLAALLVLTTLSILANSGKIQGVLGKIIRAVEDSSVALGFVFLLLAGFARSRPSQESGLALMGLGGAISGILLALALGLALVTMLIVRFALDVLVWLNPIPFIDLAFEILKVVFSVALMLLALWHPLLAAGVALGILVLALLALGWALRLAGFAHRIVLNPWLARIWPGLRPRLQDERLAERLREEASASLLCVPACVLDARGLTARRMGGLVAPRDGSPSWGARRLGRVERRPLLVQTDERLALGRCLAWLELRVLGPDGAVLDRFALSRALTASYETLRERLAAEDLGRLGASRLLLGSPGPPPRTADGQTGS